MTFISEERKMKKRKRKKWQGGNQKDRAPLLASINEHKEGQEGGSHSINGVGPYSGINAPLENGAMSILSRGLPLPLDINEVGLTSQNAPKINPKIKNNYTPPHLEKVTIVDPKRNPLSIVENNHHCSREDVTMFVALIKCDTNHHHSISTP